MTIEHFGAIREHCFYCMKSLANKLKNSLKWLGLAC